MAHDYVKLAKEGSYKDCFDIVDGHIQTFKVRWDREDVIHVCKQDNIVLTDDELDEVMYALIHEHDAEIGLSWSTIATWVELVYHQREN